MSNNAKPLRIGVAGLGVVGASLVARLGRVAPDLRIRTGRDIVIAGVSARSNRDRGLGLDGAAFQAVGPERRLFIRDHFDGVNTAFARLIWNDSWSSRVADAPPRPANELAGQAMDEASQAAMRSVLETVCQRFGVRRQAGLGAWLGDLRNAGRLGAGWRSAPWGQRR